MEICLLSPCLAIQQPSSCVTTLSSRRALVQKTCAYTAVKHTSQLHGRQNTTVLHTNNVYPTVMGLKRRLACPYTTTTTAST